MGDLINFPSRRLRDPRPSAEAKARLAETPATILLFTGVRYERMDEATPEQEQPGPKKPRGRRRA